MRWYDPVMRYRSSPCLYPCRGCGKALEKSNKSGLCRECKRKPGRRDYRMGKKCKVCAGPLNDRSSTGICTRNHECRSALATSHLLPQDYDLDTGEPIVDEIAVAILVRGDRVVAATQLEREEAIRRMIATGLGAQEIASHLGVTQDTLGKLIKPLGYRIKRRGKGSPGVNTVVRAV